MPVPARFAEAQTPFLLDLIADVETGYSLAALDRISQAVAPDDSGFRYLLVPKATLGRRAQAGGVLSTEESARVARLEKVWRAALEVWGDEAAARGYLFRPHALLQSRRPIDVVLATEFGGPLVEHLLGALQFGVAV